MNHFLTPLLGGVLGTLVMTLIQLVPPSLGYGRVDVVRALGSFVTHDRETALTPGLVMHYGMGILFAYFYLFAFRATHIPLNFLSGAFAGMIHGVTVMLAVAVVVLEHHPLARYHQRGAATGVAQVIGHIAYGATVGLVCQLMLET